MTFPHLSSQHTLVTVNESGILYYTKYHRRFQLNVCRQENILVYDPVKSVTHLETTEYLSLSRRKSRKYRMHTINYLLYILACLANFLNVFQATVTAKETS